MERHTEKEKAVLEEVIAKINESLTAPNSLSIAKGEEVAVYEMTSGKNIDYF